jgi:hypothetical protein
MLRALNCLRIDIEIASIFLTTKRRKRGSDFLLEATTSGVMFIKPSQE